MHNIGRTVKETYENNYETNYENDHEHWQSEFETDSAGEFEDNWAREYENDEYESYENQSPFNETMEMELASELLEVRNEEELGRFLGRLASRAAPQGIRNFARSRAGSMLGGVLKKVAKTALPWVGRIAGGMIGGPIGAKLGSSIGRFATRAFNLELEGLSPEDKEFALSRAFVRFGGAAAKNVQSDNKSRSQPAQAVREGVVKAARQHATGLLNPMPGAYRRARNKGVYDHRDYETTNGGYVAQEF